MTLHSYAQKGYSQATKDVAMTPRRVEYTAFARATRLLVEAQNKEGFAAPQRAVALHENQRLWVTIATLVADDDNALPKDLRGRLFYLAEFTQHHSRLVQTQGASLQPLIDINRSIMSGLTAAKGKAA